MGTSAPITFTLCGFDLKALHLKNDKLILDGWRVGLELANDQQKRVRLKVGDALIAEEEKMHIEIDADASRDYGAALNAIFDEGLTDMVSSLPAYWQKYAQKHFLPPETPSTPSATNPKDPARIGASITAPQLLPPETPSTPSAIPPKGPARIGASITAPQLLHAPEPVFTNSARALKYSGNNLFNIWIHPDGTVSHLSIVRALGLGLDESALAAVQNYRFKPAMQDGTLPKYRWTHSAHLLTGACYVHAHGAELATEYMRERIRLYNAAVGTQNTATSGYHETITVAWIKLLDRLLRDVRDSAPITRAEFAALAVERYGHDRNVFRQYYDFDLVHCTEARARWVPPNLRDFD